MHFAGGRYVLFVVRRGCKRRFDVLRELWHSSQSQRSSSTGWTCGHSCANRSGAGRRRAGCEPAANHSRRNGSSVRYGAVCWILAARGRSDHRRSADWHPVHRYRGCNLCERPSNAPGFWQGVKSQSIPAHKPIFPKIIATCRLRVGRHLVVLESSRKLFVASDTGQESAWAVRDGFDGSAAELWKSEWTLLRRSWNCVCTFDRRTLFPG